MRKTIIIMSPTVNRAVYEFKAFLSRWSTIIKRADRVKLRIELLSGHKIYFKAETQRLLGLHTNIINVDDFIMLKEEKEDNA